MIRENALGKKNSCQCVGLRYLGKFLMPIVSVCCMQAWAEEFELVSASGETKKVTQSGTYTALQDLAFGALQVAASPVIFDFSANPSRKVVFNGTSKTAFAVEMSDAEIVFKGGEWVGSGDSVDSFYCGFTASADNSRVLLDSCTWTNLSRLYVGNFASNCRLTLNNNSRFYASDCFLMRRSGASGAELNILGRSGLYFSDTGNPFRTDNDEGNSSGRVTVAGDGSILSAPYGEFRFGYKTANHYLVVSNKASLVADKFIIGVNSTATGSQVLVADSAILTAKDISIRNPGCGMTVSNATLTVDSTAEDAIKVGYAGRTGGSFVLSGEDAQIVYNPSNHVDVFAADSGGAEFRIENGATWTVVTNQIAGKTSNSVFRITANGNFIVDSSQKFHFGPAATTKANPASSLSNRLEVCDGGRLVIGDMRFSGHGNSLVISNGCVSSAGSIQIGYRRSGWDSSYNSRDCALVLRGERGQIDVTRGALQVLNGSVLRFEVPEDGYESDIIPLKVKSFSFDEGTKMEIDCEAFMYKGGKVTLVEVTGNDGFVKANNMIAAVNASLPQGCHLSVIGKKLMLTCSKRRFVFSVR